MGALEIGALEIGAEVIGASVGGEVIWTLAAAMAGLDIVTVVHMKFEKHMYPSGHDLYLLHVERIAQFCRSWL